MLIERVKGKSKPRRRNWRGRNKAAWRDLLHPKELEKVLGAPVSLADFYAEDVERLTMQVPPRGRKAFRAQLLALLNRVAGSASSEKR
jgi:hypothetical protein